MTAKKKKIPPKSPQKKSVNSAGAGLNARQDRFCLEYLKDYNGTQSAIRAGYKATTAGEMASKLLKKDNIKTRIKALQAELRRENIATIEEIEEFLSRSMRGEIDEEVVLVVGTAGGGSEAETIRKQIGIKDRIKAAELLGKRYGLWNDKLNIDLGEKTIEAVKETVSLADKLATIRLANAMMAGVDENDKDEDKGEE